MRNIIQKKYDEDYLQIQIKHAYKNELNINTQQHHIGNTCKGIPTPYNKYNARILNTEKPIYKIYSLGMPYKQRLEYIEPMDIYLYTLFQYQL